MPLLTRDQILAVDDLPFEDVDVPEWGGTVRVRTLSAYERLDWEKRIMPEGKEMDTKQFVTSLAAMCCVDENGNLLFTDADVEALGKKSIRALTRVREAATKLNAVSADAAAEVEKKSEAAPAESGSSK